jgi:prophage regulatory protein
MTEQILRFSAVSEMTGLKRTAIYAKIKAGEFPLPVPLGKRARGWRRSEVEALIKGLTPVRPSGPKTRRAAA